MTSAGEDDPIAVHRAEFVLTLRQRGIRDTAVLRAIETIPRELFVAPDHAHLAYADQLLPIACGQTLSEPFVIAAMTEALAVDDRCKVLEVGTGSGYGSAVLSRLARRVYTVDRFRTLVSAAEARFAALGIANVTMMVGDGALGWPAQAPFDRILVSASAPEPPRALLEQLKEGGVMVAPIGPAGAPQMLRRLVRAPDGVTAMDLFPVRFVPLGAGRAQAL